MTLRRGTGLLQLLTLILFFHLGAGGAFAQQYRIHTWESFESGFLPDNLVRFHAADEASVRVVDLYQGFPSVVTAGIAGLECGRYGLLWRPSQDHNHLSIFAPDGLTRARLGQAGRALYQADFFLPPEGQPVPNISLLAQVLTTESRYNFYRFGVLEDGQRVFFSFADAKAQPTIYEQQNIADFQLRRPGWHRFQIIFEGGSRIYCAVNGVQTSFSPITEATHQHLNAGIMVTSAKFNSVALTDNLSIQWTPQDAPLPLSPWTSPLANENAPNRSALETGSSVVWLNDPTQAWQAASRQRRPILVQFYIPNIGPYEYLRRIVPNDAETHQLLNNFVLLRIDVNQLLGGRLAERFQIVRIPTFLIIGPDGRERQRMVVVGGQTQWQNLRSELSSALADAGGGAE